MQFCIYSSTETALRLNTSKHRDCFKMEHIVFSRVPGITIATDVICGFPTETPEDFACTMALCRKYCFSSLFINQFYPRPGTPAAQMPRIPTQEVCVLLLIHCFIRSLTDIIVSTFMQVKQRSRELSEFFQSYHPYKGREGTVYRVLITDVAHDQMRLVGHNKFYEQVGVS